MQHKFNELGAHAYEIITNKKTDIYNDELIKKLLTDVVVIESEINHLKSEIEDLTSKLEIETTESTSESKEKEPS